MSVHGNITDYLRFDGKNVKQIVDFCDYGHMGLCHIHSTTYTYTLSGRKLVLLCIEPADTMRGSSLYITEGDTAFRYKHPDGRELIKVLREPFSDVIIEYIREERRKLKSAESK